MTWQSRQGQSGDEYEKAREEWLAAADRPMAALARALRLAEPSRYVRTFVDQGSVIARLLYEAAERDIFPKYVGRILLAYPHEKLPAAPGRQSQGGLIEPLSERELEVLDLVAQGLSNQEIAVELYISLRTVKWHTSNIYGKLGVKSRTGAVARGRTLGILPRD